MLRIDSLMDARPGAEEGDELDVLATLVEAYERVTSVASAIGRQLRWPRIAPRPTRQLLSR